MGIADCGRATAERSERTPELSGEIWQEIEGSEAGFLFSPPEHCLLLFTVTQKLKVLFL